MAASIIAGLNKKTRKPAESDDVPTHTQDLHCPMPTVEDWLHSGPMAKCPLYSRGMSWRNIFCALTPDLLAIAKDKNDNTMIDKIPLLEVQAVLFDGQVMGDEKKAHGRWTRSKSMTQGRSKSPDASPDADTKAGDEEEDERTIEIRTIAGGHNLGRKYRIRAETRAEASRWAECLHQSVRKAVKAEQNRVKKNPWQMLIHQCRKIHDGNPFQQFFGVVIMTSFMISLVRTEMVPEKDSEADGVFEIIDLVFTGLFTLELAITLLAHWFFEFWTHGWHVFDSAIVGVSLASVAIPDMPAVNSIRAIRVLRAVRLLRKSKSLAPIVHALFASILPVLNSFVLLGLITAIYASMAVGLFGPDEPLLFGKLSAAMFSMFQVCTGDAWASGIVRIMFYDEGKVSPLPVVFFMSYMMVAGVVLLNIVVAVLLDKFLTAMAESREAFGQEEAIENNPAADEEHCLDPLMEVLSKYRSLEDLVMSVTIIFHRLDLDGSGGLGYDELHDGLPKLLPMNFTLEDWYEVVEECLPAHVDADMAELDLPTFQKWIFSQLKAYLLRMTNKALVGGETPYGSILLVLKWQLVTMQEVGEEKLRLTAATASSMTERQDLSSSQILGSFKSPAPASSARKRFSNVVDNAFATHKLRGTGALMPPAAPPAADKSETDMPETSALKGALVSSAKGEVTFSRSVPSVNEGQTRGLNANGSSNAVPPSIEKASRGTSLGEGVEKHANASDEVAVGGVNHGQGKAITGPEMSKKQEDNVKADDEVKVSVKALEARLIRMEDLMLTNMASMQAQLALLIEMQVPNSRPPPASADMTSINRELPSEHTFSASSGEKRYEGAMHRPMTLHTSLAANSRMLSPPSPVPLPAEDAVGSRVFTDGHSTPKMLSPQLPHHSEEGSWIYDGPYAPASLALMKRGQESQGAVTMPNDATRNGSMHPITMIMRQADREANGTRTPARGGGSATKYSTRSPFSSPPATVANFDPEHAQAVARLNEVLFGPRSPPVSPTRQSRAGEGGH